MKATFTKDELLAKLKESFATRLTQSLEAMTGSTQRSYVIDGLKGIPDSEENGPDLGWTTTYSGGANVAVRLFASPSNWRLIGKTILEAAGVDSFDDPTLESTYTETLAQAASAWAPDLSGMAGKKWETESSSLGAESDPNAECWGYRLPMGNGEAKLYLQVSVELIATLLQPPPTPEPPPPSSAVVQDLPINPSQFDLLLDVELPVSVSFGRALVPLKEVLKLSSGSIVELNRAVTEPVEVIVNNCVIARGEVVVVEGNYGVRIQQIVSRQDRLRTVN